MSDDVGDQLHSALRNQLAAVKQHFVHVLILEAREDSESAEKIASIDSVDLPNTMQFVDYLVCKNYAIDICKSSKNLLETMPSPGFSNHEIAASERQLETELGTALERALRGTDCSFDQWLHGLLSTSHGSRASYHTWLSQYGCHTESNGPVRLELTEAKARSIDTMFANMMVMIDQTMIHAFVQYNAGQNALADLTWEVSGAAMMQAADITKRLAQRGLCADPKKAANLYPQHVPEHDIHSDPIKAFEADRKLAAHSSRIGRSAEEALADTEFAGIANQLATYFYAVALWSEGSVLPDIPNPCRDFGRT
ncbi:MAG: hypothetical protein WD005_01910, partial [Haliea sp.]